MRPADGIPRNEGLRTSARRGLRGVRRAARIGHACGHNVIAASAAGAGIGAGAVADDAGVTVTVMGTPAEEVLRSGGKIRLLEGGAFEALTPR